MPIPLFELEPLAQQAWLRERLARPAPREARNLSDGFRLPGRHGAPTPAAVLVPLINRDDGLTVLFTERSRDLPDHPGQISFPGGRVEPEDADAGIAALREAEEEVGLSRERVTLLGRLEPYETVTGYRVTPVVGWVEPPFEIKADPVEVAEVFEVPRRQLPLRRGKTVAMVEHGRSCPCLSGGPRQRLAAWRALAGIRARRIRRPEARRGDARQLAPENRSARRPGAHAHSATDPR